MHKTSPVIRFMNGAMIASKKNLEINHPFFTVTILEDYCVGHYGLMSDFYYRNW